MVQTVAVTGANRGIGLAICNAFHERGDVVYGLCRTSSDALKALGLKGGVIEGIDVSSDDIGATLQTAFKDIKLDIFLNNSGILTPDTQADFAPGEKMMETLDAMRKMFEVNTLGPLKVTAALVACWQELSPPFHRPLVLSPSPSVFRGKGGALGEGSKMGIMSSLMGSVSDNGSGGLHGYRVSKSGANMVGKGLAMDYKDKGIIVQVLHPGYIATDMTKHWGGGSGAAEAAVGTLECFDKMTMEETGTYWHTNYGKGRTASAW